MNTSAVCPPPAAMKVAASSLLAGDVIHPPAKELSLWMRQHATERGLPAEWLTLKVVEVVESSCSGWVVIVAEQVGHAGAMQWRMRAKPSTLWPVVSRVAL